MAGILIPAPAALASRIVAIGDVHGDADALTSILVAARLIDEHSRWSGGDATLVQLGDILDRGPHQRRAMDLLRRLQAEAPTSGGEVVVLLGNHEAMHLLHERRDLNPQALAEFASESSETERKKEANRAADASRRRRALVGTGSTVSRKQWLEENPQGLLPFLDSLAPEGEYGVWLRSLPAVARVGDSVFVHGGITPEVAASSIEAINSRVHGEIASADACRSLLRDRGLLSSSSTGVEMIASGTALLAQLRERRAAGQALPAADDRAIAVLEPCEPFRDWYLLNAAGPLWFRGYAWNPQSGEGWGDDEHGRERVEQTLAALGAKNVVVGHTPRLPAARIQSRFDNALILIDTGMLSSFYHGRASALEIKDGAFRALYTDGSSPLPDSGPPVSQTPRPEGTGHGPGTLGAGLSLALLQEPATAPQWSWTAASGPLPFTQDELLDYLKEAKVVAVKRLSNGVTRPLRVELERDGVKFRAVFRSVDQEWRNQQGPGGRYYRHLRDSYLFECAAYEISRRLGLDRVPPTVLRKHRGQDGSIQAWVHDAFMEAEVLRGRVSPPNRLNYTRQMIQRKMFDALINNIDRNAGNTLIDKQWRTWWIDHTRAFFTEPDKERIEGLDVADRDFLDAMRSIDREELMGALKPFLSSDERRALDLRWDAILEHFDALLEERGEDAVYFKS